MNIHEFFMKKAISEAKKAYAKGETPIGAVIVKDGKIIARGHNLREAKKNALCHAEIIAINKACKKLGGWRLFQCDMYVTLEPCLMCAGAIVQSRIKNLYFGAYDKKGGAVGSLIDIPNLSGVTQRVYTQGGILKDECSALMKDFFRELRENKY
ncbi:MAG: nucleoside deaminase [Ruminococcaceae bacterium]|nr:nucleoside deaminase [Oscillospiraceae bacterium]